MTMTGQRLCGSESHAIAGEPQMGGVCHSKNCERQAGSACSVFFSVADHLIEISSDLMTSGDHAESGNVVCRRFSFG